MEYGHFVQGIGYRNRFQGGVAGYLLPETIITISPFTFLSL